MKKMSKVLAILLSVVVFASAFAINPLAVNSSSTAKEMLDYYESCLISTSAKEDIIGVETEGSSTTTADFSSLSYNDKVATMDALDWEDKYESWEESTEIAGDAHEDYYVNGRSAFIDVFSIKREIKREKLKYQKNSAKLTEGKNGDVTITLTYVRDSEESDIDKAVFTVKIGTNGYVKSFRAVQYVGLEFDSVYGDTFKVTLKTDEIFRFNYKKVAVQGIGLAEDSFRIEAGEEIHIVPVIGPENATFKNIFVKSSDNSIAECYVDENGEVCIRGISNGKATIEIHTYDGDYVAECEVVVGRPFGEAFADFFKNLFEILFGFIIALL